MLFPRGPLERALQQDLGTRRLGAASPRLAAAFIPPFLLTTSPSQGGAGKALPCGLVPVLLPPPWDLPPSEPWRRGSLLFSALLITASSWGICWSSPSDQASHAAISARACSCSFRYVGHELSVWSHCEDRFQTSWRKKKQNKNTTADRIGLSCPSGLTRTPAPSPQPVCQQCFDPPG